MDILRGPSDWLKLLWLLFWTSSTSMVTLSTALLIIYSRLYAGGCCLLASFLLSLVALWLLLAGLCLDLPSWTYKSGVETVNGDFVALPDWSLPRLRGLFKLLSMDLGLDRCPLTLLTTSLERRGVHL